MTKNKHTDLCEAFAHHLARERKRQKLSLRALGDKAGLTGVYIYQIESGDRHPTMVAVSQIAAALGVPPQKMLAAPRK